MKTIDVNKVYDVMEAIVRYSCNVYNESQCSLAILAATDGDKELARDFETMVKRIQVEKNREIPSAMNFESTEEIATYNRIGRKLCEVFNANDYYYGGNVYNADIDAGAHVWIKPELHLTSDGREETSLRFTEELDLFEYFVQKAEV